MSQELYLEVKPPLLTLDQEASIRKQAEAEFAKIDNGSGYATVYDVAHYFEPSLNLSSGQNFGQRIVKDKDGKATGIWAPTRHFVRELENLNRREWQIRHIYG